MKAVAVDELEQDLRRYLRGARRGPRLVITEFDKPVAELSPPSVLSILRGTSAVP